MNKHIPLLATLLGVQLLLIVGVTLFDRDKSTHTSSSFLQLADQTIDAVRLMGPDGETVVLKKADDGWHIEVPGGLPANSDLPVNSEKVRSLIQKLRDATATWPVGTTDELAERFEVSQEHFQRHLQLLGDGKTLADIYLGTSPGFRKVHARLANSSNTYSIVFSNFEASLKPQDWLDKSLLKPGAELTRITREGDWTLEKVEGDWTLQDVPAEQVPDQEKIQALVTKLENLRVSGWAQDADEPGEPVFSLLVSGTDGSDIRYDFYQPEKEKDYLVRSSLQTGLFTLALYNVEPLNRQRDDLLKVPDPA